MAQEQHPDVLQRNAPVDKYERLYRKRRDRQHQHRHQRGRQFSTESDPISIIGIYFVLSLSDLSERIRPLAKVLAFLGRHSFDIMAIHFTLFKLIDFAYARFILKEIPETLSNFPVSFRYEMGPFYILIGLFLPALIGWCIDRIAAKFLS